ncbi:hypothetical protein [Streptomyces sp. NPDC005799]|uniref:hypothetical protein n=1 Tax=Streptomyces sp. NPDC005799 TaxID=3154678 RepID=UPI0033D9D845
MLNRPAAAHAELQDLSDDLEVKAARRKWNPALHPRDSKGRFIETGGTVRLWGGKLARVVRALPNDRILVQDQTGENEFNGRRHTTSAKWVSMVARPDGSAPTDNEDKVVAEDEKRDKDPRRGNGVAHDDDGDPDTPNDPHDVDDRGRPIGEDDDPVGSRENDDQDEPADGKHPINVHALPNKQHIAGGRFSNTAAVRQHFLDLADRPGTKPEMAKFLRSIAGDDDLRTSADGRLAILGDDSTGRWYLTATGTGQRMNMAGDFATPEEATDFAAHLNRTAPTEGAKVRTWSGFDFSNPNLDEAASTWRSSKGENIQAAIKRARAEFDNARTPDNNGPATISRSELKPGDRIKVTVDAGDIEWPDSTRDQDKPETVTVEGTVAPSHRNGTYTPLLDATLTRPDGTVMTSGDSARIMHMPAQIERTGHTSGSASETRRVDQVRVGDVLTHGDFGHVVTDVRRYPGGRTFTTRNLGGRREVDQFGANTSDTLPVVPRASRRPEDVQRDTPTRTQQHPNSTDAKRAAEASLNDWEAVNALAEKQWPEGAPAEFRALSQHMRNISAAPEGPKGYEENGEAMHRALAAIDDLDTDSLDRDILQALHRLEGRLDDNADRFVADARAIRENRRKRAQEPTSEPLQHDWDNPQNLVTLTMPEALADFLHVEETAAMEDPDTRKALTEATRGRNGTLKVTAPIETHRALLEWAWTLAGGEGLDSDPKEIRAYNNYTKRVDEAAAKLQQSREERHVDAPDANVPDAGSGGADAPSADAPNAEPSGQGDDGGVILSPDEVNAPAAAAHGAKAPSTMDDGEIRDEIVSLMEREMANGGELEGPDRTRLAVLEAEEATRAGRTPKREEPKPKPPAEEPGGLFDVGPDEQQRFVADPNNPDDQADDPTGTPDMFADAEGRDTSRLRPPQSRKPADFQVGDRFVDADGRTHTVAEPPLRTPRGRIRVVGEDGEHFLAADRELRVLHPDEDAPAVPGADTPDANAPAGDAPSADTPDNETPEADTQEPNAADAPAADATPATPDAEPAAAPADQVRIDHSGTGTTVRFPTPNGMVSDEEFAVLRRLGFKGSRDRTQPRFFYLPSNMTLSRREDKVRQLKEWLDGRGVAYHAPQDDAEKPDLTPEQLDQLKDRYHAPAGTWATTDFQPGDEVWTGRSWDTVDSVGPKNLRLQGRGSTPYDSVLARRRGGQIRTMFDAPADDGTPRPGADDPKTMRDEQIAQELAHLRGATLPEGNDPSSRAVRRQVTARIRALSDAQSERTFARRRDEMGRRDQAGLVRDPARLARLKGEQVQGRDGAPIGIVYPEKKGKWVFVDRDGRTPTTERYPSRAAAITALNKLTDRRNQRAGEGWKHSAWDDVQPGDTIRLPELGRAEGAQNRGRIVTGWSEPLEVSEIRRGDMGQVLITGRRGDEDVQLEVPRTDATFGTSKPGTVPDREPSDAGGGMDWRQMRPDDFGQDEIPAAAGDQNQPRPTDEFGTPDLIANGTPDTPEASGTPDIPEAADRADNATAPDAPIRNTSPADMTDEDIDAELEELQAWQNRHVASNGEGPRVQGNAMLAISPVANRRGHLREEQRKREIARKDREKREKEKQDRAEALARAEIGKRNDDGSYPVTVDGEDAGTVGQLARKWRYTDDNGDTSPDFYPSRTEAVAALVRNRDARRANADEDARREQARSEAPEGWTLGDRADVAENDIIRVPITQRDGNGRPYPVGWRQPVRVNSVTRNDNGTTVLSVSNLDGSRSDISPVFLSHPDDTFAWSNDRTRPEPTPAWRHELRARMADIGDDIATLQNREGLQDPERIQRLQDLIQRVSRGETDDLQGDLRQIRDEAAWLESQFDDPDLELPYETRRAKSWATAARMKAERDLRYPDFQQGGTPDEGAPESTAPGQADEFAAVRQRYDGDMVSADKIQVGDWVHTVSADPAYNEPMHMVGRVIHATPLSNGQVRIEVESDVTINGKPTVRTEFAMFRGTDLVERLPEGNPGREDTSDLARRIEGANGQRVASKVRVPEGWRAVDGSQIQPQPGDRFRIALRGRGGLTDREHMNVTVERPAEREGYWRVKGQPLSFRTSDIVAVPDGADAPSDGPDANAPDVDDRTTRARNLFGEGMNAVGGDSLPEMQELDDRLGRADSGEDRDAELRDIADRMDGLADQYELAGPQGELAADRFRRAARIARGEQDDRDERRGDDNGDGQVGDAPSTDGESNDGQNDDNRDETTGEDAPENEDDGQGDQDDEQRQGDEESHQQRPDADGGAAAPDGEPDAGGAGTPNTPENSDDSTSSSDDEGDGPDNTDDEEDRSDIEENDENDEEERRRRRRRRNRGGGNGGPGGGGPGGVGLPHLNLPDLNVPTATGTGGDGGNGDAGDRHGDRSRRPRHSDVDSLRNAWRTGDGLTPAEDTPERRALLAELADREGLALSPEGGLAVYPEPQADGTTLWRFAQARNGTNLPGITLTSDDPEEARALAGRFEEITDRNGDPFDWNEAWGPASVAAWRDGEGRNLPQALRAVQDDYEQERNGAFTLPEDLTTVSDPDLENALRQGLGPEDEFRVMAEMDRRDGYVDERIRAAVPETPPTNPEEAEREGRLMDEALGFGDTDVTQPAPATPGRLRREFDALDEERFQAAMQATGGRILSPEAEADGIDPRAVFSGGKFSNKRAQDLASQELKDWWEGNGRLTYPQYRQREADRVLRAEFADWDEARYRQAVDFTNGYFFRREYKFGGTDFDERELFSGGSLSARDRWQQYASEELQEWFDLNGGRQTFAQYKQSRQDSDRADRHQHEEDQRRAAEEGAAAGGAPEDTTPFTADEVTPAPPFNPADVESEEDAAFRFGGHDRMKEFADRAELRPVGNGDSQDVWLDGQQIGTISALRGFNGNPEPVWDARPFFGLAHDRNSRSQSRDTAIANLVVRALQDGPADPANPSDDVWDTVTVHLAGMTRELPELPESLRNDLEARARYERLTGMVDAFRDQRSPSGNLRDDLAQARDDFAWLRSALDDPKRNNRQREELSDLDTRAFWAGRILDGLGGPDSDLERPRAQDEPKGDGDTPSPAVPTPDEPVNTPENTPRSPAEPDPEPEPEPIGGQPAHWARVEDLAPGDMVRMTGTTKKGKPVQRAGYAYTAPVRVEVTRRGRTEQMWRCWVTEHPDGTGAAGNVYTSINATAARAEAPDDVVPGSPASGAQAALRSGDLPGQIPADRDGRGLFPGSTVTGSNDREGTVTGATDTTVAVHWSDGNDDTALSPTSLTVTDSERPDGWTADGHRVTTQNVVSDTDGSLLGPVDDVDGDNVTITTADGTITRSAGDLSVTGQVRDDVPDTAPVTGIDEPAAADLKDGDVVLLDLDGHLSTVAITSPPSRDGDRVTIQYADTTTGEMGEIDVDARAVLPRAQGPDGGAPDLGPDDAPEPADDLVVHDPPHPVDPVTGPTVDPELTPDERDAVGDHADGPDDDPDAHQGAVRITANLPLSPDHARALAGQLRASADPSTPEGRSALRAADRLDRAAGWTPPPGFNRPRPMNVSQIGEGDYVAMPDARRGDQIHVYRVIDVEEAPGGMRGLLLEDENHQWRRRTVPGSDTVWQLPEAQPDPVTPPDIDDTDTTPDPSTAPGFGIPGGPLRRAGDDPSTPATPSTPSTPDSSSTPDEPSVPVARVRPGSLRVGDVIDAPVSRTGYQFNGHRRLTIISEPQRNGWWMQLTGMDEDGNVHDFGLHNGRAVNVYDRNRPTPALPPAGTPRDPNQVPQADVDGIVSDHSRSLAARIIDEAVAGTEPPGDIHALREQIAQRLTAEALRDARRAAHRDGAAALNAAGLTGRDRIAALRRLRETRDQTHKDTVRAALRTINDLEPLPDESNEDLAARARDLLRLIPDQVAGRPSTTDPDADPDVTQTVTGHADDAVNALLQQLQAAGFDSGDAERIARTLTQNMAGSRQATARRIAARVAAVSPEAGRQPGLLARIVAALIRMSKRLAELVKAGARKIAEKYRNARERMARLRAFLGRMVRRVRQWPESRRLARLHRAVNLPDADGNSLAARISHWAGLMPEPGRFGQSQRRVTFWRPTTWGQLAAGRLPDRSDRIQWTPDRAADGGPGLTALRHMAALRAAGSDVDQDVTRRLSAALGDDFGDDPHATLQHADDYVASSERRLVNLQAARSGATIPDDEDLEVEITAARAELAASRRDYADMRAQYAAAVPDAVAAALADIRDMGPDGNAAIVFGRDTDPDAERAVRGVQRLIPRAWLNTPEARHLTAVDGTQGRYEPEGQRITVADLADEGMGTAGYALAQHFARHLGDLDSAQRAFWFTQTHTGRPGARRMRPSALSRLLRRQQTQPETGDTLARSVQAMFSGDWYQDDDLRAFLLGLMATR